MRLKRIHWAVLGAVLLLVLLILSPGLLEEVGQKETIAKAATAVSVPAGEREGKPNLLIKEESPYLLQHAHNPVDWYPWGEEAFRKARREGKPIFLSVGYSTCHWCHVMARESFSDPEIATLLNQHFVSIKVDREERPDIDQVYMTFVQATTGRGGWPLSAFLTPDLKPFLGGTYFRPQDFLALLKKVAGEWATNSPAILTSAGRISEALTEFRVAPGDDDLKVDSDLLDDTYEWYVSAYDSSRGGFGQAPKFPRPVNFNFLLRYHFRSGDDKALEMVSHTLRKMAQGGMYDHIGGGFHRYSTDGRWFLPHFEKMLYDQAQLAISYLETYQLTNDPFFSNIAREILEYVLRDMTGKEGGGYSAEDADSAVSHANPEVHKEGAFYVWSHQEVVGLLGKDAAIFNYYYGIKKDGNVDQDPFGEFRNKNVLYVAANLDEMAEQFSKSVDEIREVLRQGRKQLLERRSRRPRPFLDDKVLTAWNGLMISAFAKAHQVLKEEKYLKAAERAASLISSQLYDGESKLLKRRYRAGKAGIDGFVDDYVFFIQGLLDLYETSLEGRWLLLAMDLIQVQSQLFMDEDQGGFYSTSGRDSSILIRMKEDYDGAEPSPNSIAALNLLRLSQMANNQKWRGMAEETIRAFRTQLSQAPQRMPQMMVALNFQLDKPKQILIAGEQDSPQTQAILCEVHRRFIPNKIVVLADGGEAHRRLASSLRVLDSLRPIDQKSTAYICDNYVCSLPTNEVEGVSRLLEEAGLPSKR